MRTYEAMNGKLIIEESMLSEILTDLNGLEIANSEFGYVNERLSDRISKVESLLKNIEPYEVICGKCGLRESGNKPDISF